MDQKRKVVPEKVGEALIKAGVIHSAEDAALVIDLLYELALLFYRQHAHEL